MKNDFYERARREKREQFKKKDEALQRCKDAGVTEEAVLDLVLEMLSIETGLEKEFFRNAPIKEVERTIGIPRYRISRDVPGRRTGPVEYEEHNNEYHFDVRLLYN